MIRTASLAAMALTLSAPAWAAPQDLINNLTVDDTWATRVKQVMVAMYDLDGSGSLDTASDVAAVECDVFKALDAGTRAAWDGTGVRVIYGFDEPYGWVGSALGFDESVRDAAANAMGRCGVSLQKSAASTEGSGDTTAHSVANIASDSDDWSDQVKVHLLASYDVDGSGELTTATEVSAISCDVWRVMDRAVRSAWSGSSIRVIYGFDPDYIWVGNTFGIDESQRELVVRALTECGVSGQQEQVDNPPADIPAVATAASPPSVASQINDLSTSSAWNEAVGTAMRAAYDLNDSGLLDNGREIKAIPCTVWAAMDRHVLEQTQDAAGLRSMYGFAKGFIWGGTKLGIHEGRRKQVDKAMLKCGLR
jgi:hypothetical protein